MSLAANNRKYFFETPIIIRVLSKFAVDWKRASGGEIVYVKDAPFRELFIRSIPILIGVESKTEFSCFVTVVSEGNMDETKAETYRNLKGMECELHYSGLLSKKPYFRTLEILEEIRKHIPKISFNNTLVDAIHRDERTMELIKKVQPEDFKISLVSTSRYDFSSIYDSIRTIASFYNRPTTITWVLVLTKFVTSGLRYEENVKGMFNILRYVASITRNLTEDRLSTQSSLSAASNSNQSFVS